MQEAVQIDLVALALELLQARAKIRVLVERMLAVKIRHDEQRGLHTGERASLERELDLSRVRGGDVVDRNVNGHDALFSTAYARSDA